MKTRNLIATSSLALTMMLGIVATPLSAQQTYTPGVTVEKNTNPEWEADYTATFIYKDKDARDDVAIKFLVFMIFSIQSYFATSCFKHIC